MYLTYITEEGRHVFQQESALVQVEQGGVEGLWHSADEQHEALGCSGFSGILGRGALWSLTEVDREEAEDVGRPFSSVISW